MTRTELYQVTVKLMGLYFLFQAVDRLKDGLSPGGLSWVMPFTLASIVVGILCIRNSEKIIHWLKLEDEKPITISWSESHLFGAAILFAGVWLLVNSLSELMGMAFIYSQGIEIFKIAYGEMNEGRAVVYLFQLVASAILLLNFRGISNRLSKDRLER
jgi:energy-converting hydrogenase Eha subunit A